MSLFSRLFRRRSRQPEAAPLASPIWPEGVETVSPAGPVGAPDLAVHAPPPSAPLDDAETPAQPEAAPDADAFALGDADDEPDADAADATGPDPFIGTGEPLQISLPTEDGLAAARRNAEALALGGPQRVTLADPAGPGSLAETLARLEVEGRLTSEVVDDPEDGPFILYRPVSAG